MTISHETLKPPENRILRYSTHSLCCGSAAQSQLLPSCCTDVGSPRRRLACTSATTRTSWTPRSRFALHRRSQSRWKPCARRSSRIPSHDRASAWMAGRVLVLRCPTGERRIRLGGILMRGRWLSSLGARMSLPRCVVVLGSLYMIWRTTALAENWAANLCRLESAVGRAKLDNNALVDDWRERNLTFFYVYS